MHAQCTTTWFNPKLSLLVVLYLSPINCVPAVRIILTNLGLYFFPTLERHFLINSYILELAASKDVENKRKDNNCLPFIQIHHKQVCEFVRVTGLRS